MRIPLPTTRSLSFRLFVLATVWSLVALVVAGVILLENYRRGAVAGHEAILNVYLLNVIASINQAEDGTLVGTPETGDPRFHSLYSGWYWQVVRPGDLEAFITSPSLGGERLELPDTSLVPYDANFRRIVEVPGPQGTTLKAIEQVILLDDSGEALRFLVASDVDVTDSMVASFRNQLLVVFAILGIGLVAVTVFQVRLGLRPLRDVGRSLAAIREGKAERLEGEYPDEVAPLTRELNALIESNAKIVERARMHVGNLAHALKTPLSVITNEVRAAQGPLGEKVIEQTGIMRHQVDYYLDRAQMAARAGVIGAVTEVRPVVEALERAMSRIYAERGIEMKIAVEPDLKFQGEKQDLEELVGNLVDNAFKWARSKVRLDCHRAQEEGDRIEIVVDDDGPGLSPDERREAMRRGSRLDETIPGSGLGLSIVHELAELYQGRLELRQSPAGGLRAVLRLPAA